MSNTETTYEVSDFQADVIESSKTIPVLVDFWAPWCGPCHMLGPVLEKLAQEQEGAWRLVKVNTDEHQEVSARYGIRGIPAVKLFVDGNVVQEFTGALPEHTVRQWLEQALPSENKQRLQEAHDALQAGNFSRAGALLEQVLAEDPGNAEAGIALARLVAFVNPDRAALLADAAANANPVYLPHLEAIRTIAHLRQIAEPTAALPDEPGKEAYIQGAKAILRSDFDTALEQFIRVIQQNRPYDDDGARKACVALFTLLGEQHAAVQKWRRTFDSALY
jgi:putative thioredoxin